MYYTDIYDKILFLIIMCSSFLNVVYTMSMNKSVSRFKLLGFVFFIPFGLCSFTFLFSADTTASLALSLSEFCLSAGILLLLLHPYNTKNHYIKTYMIVIFPLLLAAYSIQSEQFIYFSFSVIVRNILIAACISTAIIYIKKRNIEQKLMIPLSIWLAGILLGFFEGQAYVREAALIVKMSAYTAFFLYFYKTTYNAYIKRIDESEKLIDTMERSLNKEVKKRVFEIERSNERLLEMSKTDLLTKSFNKITILNIIEKIINSKKEEVFSILMFDIDNFKTINDSLGHVTGDLCLKTLANIASSNIREVDFLGRYGGDEFVIVLPSLAENEAKFVAERFKKKVNETSNPKFTVSIGISTYPHDGQTVKDLISAADKGLYKSKNRGKNTISHA
ncbi:MAG TPA: GGDEF domain-containing protein [Clostridia bacterium]|nr:GGDEF domain-containing protein [Clostridia bacterium]